MHIQSATRLNSRKQHIFWTFVGQTAATCKWKGCETSGNTSAAVLLPLQQVAGNLLHTAEQGTILPPATSRAAVKLDQSWISLILSSQSKLYSGKPEVVDQRIMEESNDRSNQMIA